MTSFGILMPSLRPASTVPAGDNRIMQIRTRRARDLEILRTEYMKETLGPTVYMRNTDYEYRAYCTPEAWADAMARMSLDIDYTKFKPTTERYHDSQLHNLYNRLWGIIFSTLSTTKHQNDYWGLTNRNTRKSVKHGKLQKNRLPQWWDQLPDVNDDDFSDVLDSYLDRYESVTLNVDTSDVDSLTEPPYESPVDGHLDHSDCDHANTRNARRRCRNRWLSRAK